MTDQVLDDNKNGDGLIHSEILFCFFASQLQRLVTTGALPCSKEEAASLAAIQLRLQECLPSIKLPSSKFLSHQSCATTNNANQNNQVSFFFSFFFFLPVCCVRFSFFLAHKKMCETEYKNVRVFLSLVSCGTRAGDYNKTGRYRARGGSRRKRPAASSARWWSRQRKHQRPQEGRLWRPFLR